MNLLVKIIFRAINKGAPPEIRGGSSPRSPPIPTPLHTEYLYIIVLVHP